MARTIYTPAFYSKLIFEDSDGLPFTLTQPLTYVSDVLVEGPYPKRGLQALATVIVPAGFRTDLASIPRILWSVLPPIGKYDRAAVVHDFLYQQAPLGISRSEADAVLDEAMKVCGVGRFARWIIYAGVRSGGWVPWRKYRSTEQS